MKKIELNQEIISIYEKQMAGAYRAEIADIIEECDLIQETILAILEKQENIEEIASKTKDTNHCFNRIKRQKKWDLYRKNKKRIEKLECHFETFEIIQYSEGIDIFGSEEKTGFNDTISYINSKLSADDFKIFDLYFLQDKTNKQISKIIGQSERTTDRIVQKVQNHVMRLKIKEIYDIQYITPGGTCKGKWRINYDQSASDIKRINPDKHVSRERKPHTIQDTEYAKKLKIKIELKKDYYGDRSDGILYKQ